MMLPTMLRQHHPPRQRRDPTGMSEESDPSAITRRGALALLSG